MRSLATCVLALAVVLGVGQARAEVVIDYDTTIDYTINDSAAVIEGTNPPTTVEVVETGRIRGSVSVRDSSILTMRGGNIGGISTFDLARLNVFGGELGQEDDGGQLHSYGSSVVSVFGGAIFDDVTAYDSSAVRIIGGRVGEGANAEDSSRVDVFGGTIDELRSGSPTGQGTHACILSVYGTDFNYSYGAIHEPSGTLTGILANGDPIEATFEIYDNASIVLLVPEPSSVLLLSVAALGILGSVWLPLTPPSMPGYNKAHGEKEQG